MGARGRPHHAGGRSRRLAPGSGWRTRWTRAGSSQRAGQAKPWEAPWPARPVTATCRTQRNRRCTTTARSEEHTSELQSQSNLVCRLLLEKKKKKQQITLDVV